MSITIEQPTMALANMLTGIARITTAMPTRRMEYLYSNVKKLNLKNKIAIHEGKSLDLPII